MSTPRILLGASALFLFLSIVFGVLNSTKGHALREEIARAENGRNEAERRRANREKEMRAREAAVADANAKANKDQSHVASAEEDLVKSQTEKEQLQTKLRENETVIADLKKQIEQNPTAAVPAAAPGADVAQLQAQLAEAKQQLDAAEREKELLSDKIHTAQERTTQLETEKKRRVAVTGSPGVRGTVLAVNQAYNFVVLNLGGRQGLEANSEMLVMRGGTLIGKIRISSVEPATAIGDIISTSLARGVQVQPGDTVIYAGSNS
ncbi:MAG: hypothetical protein ACJ8I9_05940 [Chthoniobacterales bacterium]